MRKVSRGLLGYVLMIAVFIFLIVILSGGVSGASKRIEYPKLLQLIESDQVDRVSIRGTSLVGRLKDSKISLADYPTRSYDFETTIGADFYDTVIKMAAGEKNLSVDEVSVHDLDFEIPDRKADHFETAEEKPASAGKDHSALCASGIESFCDAVHRKYSEYLLQFLPAEIWRGYGSWCHDHSGQCDAVFHSALVRSVSGGTADYWL